MTEARKPMRMLALDGGGLMGLISLGILREIEAQMRDAQGGGDDFRLGAAFDYVGGTSTGAIIAAGLALGKTVDEIAALYTGHATQMFSKASWFRRLRTGLAHKYSHAGLEAMLKTECSRDSIAELQARGRLSKQRHLLIISRNKTTGSCWPLSTNPDAYYNNPTREDCNLNLPLWQVVRASTAAPYYFAPEHIRIHPTDGKRQFHFEDGGLTAHNNPALKLFQLATMPEYSLHWPTGEDKLMIISVGTGRNHRRRAGISRHGDHALKIASQTPSSLMSGVADENDLTCRLIGRCTHGAKIDNEVGDLVSREPLSTSTRKAFLYARYDADISEKGLEQIGETASDKDLEMDSVSSVELFGRIGRAAATQVDLKAHFGALLLN